MRIVTVQKLRLSRGEKIVKSPLQRTLTAHIMSRWAKQEGALAHISLQRSVEMLALQCAQRGLLTLILLFSQSFFLPLSLNPHSLMCLRRRLSRCTSTGTSWFSVGTFSAKVCNSFPTGRLAGFFLQEFRSAHHQDACPRSQSHALLLQDVHRSFG